MTVTFELKLIDWKAFLRAINGLPTHMLGIVPLILLAQGVFFAVSNQTLRHNFAARGLVVLIPNFLIFAVGLVGCVVMYHLAILNTRMHFQKSSFAVGPTIIVIDEEEIAGAITKKREAFSWLAIDRILESETHFFVLITRKSAFIVPKRAFDSPAQCAEFGAFIQRKWSEHHPDAAPIAPAK